MPSTALVTGASRGIGRAAAIALARAGHAVVINGRDPEAAELVAGELRGAGFVAETLAFDVTDAAAAAAALADRRIDVLVNNVGHRDRRGLAELQAADLSRLFDTHLLAAFSLSKLVAAGLVERGAPGRIVNVSSVMGQLGRRGDVAYATAKAGLNGLTRGLAADLGPAGITVNAVAAGPIATEVNAALATDPEWQAWIGSRSMLGRWGTPEDVAGAIVFLAGDASSFITGQVLAVDGGMTTTF